MHSYTIRGDLGPQGETVSRNFKAESDEKAVVYLARMLGVRSQRKGREFRRRNRKNTLRKIPGEILAEFGDVRLFRDDKQILPRLRRKPKSKKFNRMYPHRSLRRLTRRNAPLLAAA